MLLEARCHRNCDGGLGYHAFCHRKFPIVRLMIALGFRLCIDAAACCLLGLPAALHAQSADPAATFPVRPIRVVVGFTPGTGLPDITVRIIGPKLYEALHQQVVVDNRPGAGGVIATDIVAKANPDGYTLLSASSGHVSAPAVHATLPYDTLKDFAAITLTSKGSYVLVVAGGFGARSMKDLIALAKSKPGQLNFASAGTGSGTHFAAELLKDQAGINIVHVPYKGPAEAMTDTMAGRVQFFMPPLASASALIRDGKLLALAVTGHQRVAGFENVPTLRESGLTNYDWDAWSGLLAPAKTPRAIIEKLNRTITQILSLPEIQQRLAASGVDAAPTTPAQFDKLIANQVALTTRLARASGIKAN